MGWISAIFDKGRFGGLLEVFLVLLLFVGCLGVSKRISYFRLNDHVFFFLLGYLSIFA